jgi:hypothetical protein
LFIKTVPLKLTFLKNKKAHSFEWVGLPNLSKSNQRHLWSKAPKSVAKVAVPGDVHATPLYHYTWGLQVAEHPF